MNTISGTIKIIGNTNTFGASGFRKREFIVTTPGDYPQDVKLEFYQNDCAKLDAFSVGDEVTASFNIKGNEYKGKYYVNLQAWKIQAGQDQSSSPKASQKEEPAADLAEGVAELADAPF